MILYNNKRVFGEIFYIAMCDCVYFVFNYVYSTCMCVFIYIYIYINNVGRYKIFLDCLEWYRTLKHLSESLCYLTETHNDRERET